MTQGERATQAQQTTGLKGILGFAVAMSSRTMRRAAILFASLLAIPAVAYLAAASTLTFREWRGDRDLGQAHYEKAIHWYTRALRLTREFEPDAVDVSSRDTSADQLRLTEKLYQAYEGFCRWDFEDEKLRGWYAARDINLLEVGQGILVVGSTGKSPYLEIQKLGLAPNRPYLFEVRQRCRTGSRAELFWAPATDVFSPMNHATHDIDCSGNWIEYQFGLPPMTEGPGKFRFSPTNGTGNIHLDWIRIVPVAQKAPVR